MILKWESIYSVNVKEIDNQHKKLFSIINHLFEIKKDFSKKNAIKVIKELKDYGIYHLNTEEKYFKKFNYQDKKLHILQHDMYKEKIIEFEEKINKSKEITVFKELTEFLRNWWLNHIQNSDQQYSKFFNQKGLF